MRGTVCAAAVGAALSLLADGAQAHMIMKTPVPFGLPALDNSPLTDNFPCKVTGDPAAFFDRATTKPTVMGVGETQTLSFRGSAVHGGGSCQLAVTADKVPSKTSKWQVILSLEGGCPSKGGSDPSEYAFKIPDQVQPGEYVFAWTWISKLSGQPEYYMNCAPITVTAGGGGGSKKRDGGDSGTSSAALPDLFVANLANVNSCKTTPGTDVLYPQPGPYVEKLGAKNNFAEISVKSGQCTASGGGSDAPGSGSGNGGGGGDNGGSGSPSNGGGGGSPGDGGNGNGNGGSGSPSNGGGGSDNGGGGSPNNGGGGSPDNGGGGGSGSAPPATTLVSSTASAPAAGPTGGPSGGGLSGACSEEGVFNCIGGTSYQQCASGQWTALQAMPSGTKCKLGQSSTLWNRAEPRPRPVRHML